MHLIRTLDIHELWSDNLAIHWQGYQRITSDVVLVGVVTGRAAVGLYVSWLRLARLAQADDGQSPGQTFQSAQAAQQPLCE